MEGFERVRLLCKDTEDGPTSKSEAEGREKGWASQKNAGKVCFFLHNRQKLHPLYIFKIQRSMFSNVNGSASASSGSNLIAV